MSTTQLTHEQTAILESIASGVIPNRTPILKTPADYGLSYEDVFFSSMDGIALEAWFIPAEGSDKLIICNHPMTMNRYGFPGHLAPWSSFSDVVVEFGNVYKALVNAGYNVLTYDMRNHGRSASANGGVCGTGLLEYRDVIGAMQYVQSHESLGQMTVGLFNPCAGGNAAMVAMKKHPEYFTDVKALVSPQPCSMLLARKAILEPIGLDGFIPELDEMQVKLGGFTNAEMSPHEYAKSVTMPTLLIQVTKCPWSTQPLDVQTTFDNLPLASDNKKLFWIEDTDKRFDGYNYFGKHPEMMVDWFNKYMC